MLHGDTKGEGRKGVIPMGSGWFEEYSISAAHTESDITETLNITEDVHREVKKICL